MVKKISVVLMVVGLVCGLSGAAWAADAGDKININTATLDELTQLKGVGEVLAQKIIDYRMENGPFGSVNDLLNVQGIGPKILSDNMDKITVGESKKAPAPAPTAVPAPPASEK